MKFRIIVEADDDGVFVATVPSLPGCISQGTMRAEALSNVREAIKGYLESLRSRRLTVSDHREVAKGALRALIREAGIRSTSFTALLHR